MLAVDDVSLEIAAGEICGIIGYSGAGKSTVLRLVNALEAPTSGSVEIDGSDITRLRERELRALRGDIGMIFQQFNLFESRTVAGNVAYPLRGRGALRARAIKERVAELLELRGPLVQGPELPRTALRRAEAAGRHRASAGDEPPHPPRRRGDERARPDTTQEVLELLRRVNAELGITILVITHEMDVIRTLADRVVVMEGGRIIESGDVFDVFSAPQNAATQRFVASIIEDVPVGEQLQTLRVRHPGRIVTFTIRDGDVTQADVFAALSAHGVRFELIHGGINDIRGRVVRPSHPRAGRSDGCRAAARSRPRRDSRR